MMLEDLYRLLKSGHVQAQGIVDTMTQPLVVLDHHLCIANANNAFINTFKVERDLVLGQSLFSLGDGQWDIPDLKKLIEGVIPKAAAVIGYEVTHNFPGLGQRTFLVDAQRLVHPDNNSTGILVMFEDITDRRRHDVQRDLVISETRHRMKNLFAVIQAIAMHTEVTERTAEEYRDALLGRLKVALSAQEIAADAQTTDFATLLNHAVSAAGRERIHIKPGPSVELSQSKVVPASMIFHELTTNAMKYGALSVSTGEVHVTWRLERQESGRQWLICEWQEINGPLAKPPQRRGYGTQLIEGTARHLGGAAELTFDKNGLTAIIKLQI